MAGVYDTQIQPLTLPLDLKGIGCNFTLNANSNLETIFDNCVLAKDKNGNKLNICQKKQFPGTKVLASIFELYNDSGSKINNATVFGINGKQNYVIKQSLDVTSAYGRMFIVQNINNNKNYILKVCRIGGETTKESVVSEMLIQHIIYESTKYQNHSDCIYAMKIHEIIRLKFKDNFDNPKNTTWEHCMGIIMELADPWTSVQTSLKGPTPYDPQRALIKICRMLQNLQTMYGFVHGDLHAGNAYYNKDSQGASAIKLIDFGRSRLTIKDNNGAKLRLGQNNVEIGGGITWKYNFDVMYFLLHIGNDNPEMIINASHELISGNFMDFYNYVLANKPETYGFLHWNLYLYFKNKENDPQSYPSLGTTTPKEILDRYNNSITNTNANFEAQKIPTPEQVAAELLRQQQLQRAQQEAKAKKEAEEQAELLKQQQLQRAQQEAKAKAEFNRIAAKKANREEMAKAWNEEKRPVAPRPLVRVVDSNLFRQLERQHGQKLGRQSNIDPALLKQKLIMLRKGSHEPAVQLIQQQPAPPAPQQQQQPQAPPAPPQRQQQQQQPQAPPAQPQVPLVVQVPQVVQQQPQITSVSESEAKLKLKQAIEIYSMAADMEKEAYAMHSKAYSDFHLRRYIDEFRVQSEQDIPNVEQRVNELRQQKLRVETELSNAKKELEPIQSEYNYVVKEINSLEKQLEKLRNENERLKQLLRMFTARRRGNDQALENTISDLEEKIRVKENEIMEPDHQLYDKKQQRDNIMGHIERFKDIIRKANSKLENANAQFLEAEMNAATNIAKRRISKYYFYVRDEYVPLCFKLYTTREYVRDNPSANDVLAKHIEAETLAGELATKKQALDAQNKLAMESFENADRIKQNAEAVLLSNWDYGGLFGGLYKFAIKVEKGVFAAAKQAIGFHGGTMKKMRLTRKTEYKCRNAKRYSNTRRRTKTRSKTIRKN